MGSLLDGVARRCTVGLDKAGVFVIVVNTMPITSIQENLVLGPWAMLAAR